MVVLKKEIFLAVGPAADQLNAILFYNANTENQGFNSI